MGGTRRREDLWEKTKTRSEEGEVRKKGGKGETGEERKETENLLLEYSRGGKQMRRDVEISGGI